MWSVRVCSESHADSIRMAPDQEMMICRVHNTSSNVGKRSSGGHTFPALFLFFLLFFALISGSHHFSSSARDVPGSDSQNTYRSSLLPENTPRLGFKKSVAEVSSRGRSDWSPGYAYTAIMPHIPMLPAIEKNREHFSAILVRLMALFWLLRTLVTASNHCAKTVERV